MATPCGHLYCFDCTTFHFASESSAAPCAVCRTPQPLEALIKLYPDYDTPSQPASISNSRLREEADDIVESGRQALSASSIDTDTIANITSSVQGILDSVTEQTHPDTEFRPLLRSIGTVLADIRTRVQELHTLRQGELAQAEIERINALARQQIEHARNDAKEDVRKYRQAYKRRETKLEQENIELQIQLENVRRKFVFVTSEHESGQHDLATLRGEVEALKKSSLKYQKKYHALRQSHRSLKRSASGGLDDDDLEVI
ncbi:unnamed protein product [Somion occarium]|uniref:RING-type domain-containing protein n=1 Tax=Somion occarium TaxID=3059160 RepID=A0ABP1DDG4_9APHY